MARLLQRSLVCCSRCSDHSVVAAMIWSVQEYDAKNGGFHGPRSGSCVSPRSSKRGAHEFAQAGGAQCMRYVVCGMRGGLFLCHSESVSDAEHICHPASESESDAKSFEFGDGQIPPRIDASAQPELAGGRRPSREHLKREGDACFAYQYNLQRPWTLIWDGPFLTAFAFKYE